MQGKKFFFTFLGLICILKVDLFLMIQILIKDAKKKI
jgi:hypothetical protein